ncbi:hypothetical protein [Streptantibioticus ferralitis]|uniref:Uncharacterized protein n=1 Tax=Streptantibioticus ferralitis TaxID=236510 RepID=A0ABT5Z9E5_9ACTN|nr:hypothetical protein [Streptantibioticus ferralitis]MDF2259680.1 hypothetical protein [Streptantibioticus ferralitis]
MALVEACGPCILYLDRVHTARAHWQRQGATPTTPEELTSYYVPVAPSPEYADRLREWAASLMRQLDADTVAALVYGVRGQVIIPDAQMIPPLV